MLETDRTRIPLRWGENERDGQIHQEYHAPCGCAWHQHDKRGSDDPARWTIAPHWHPCPLHRNALSPEEAASIARSAVIGFAKAILHGDDAHRAWLKAAAESFTDHATVPPVPPAAGRRSLEDVLREAEGEGILLERRRGMKGGAWWDATEAHSKLHLASMAATPARGDLQAASEALAGARTTRRRWAEDAKGQGAP